jgi:pimeloyl-ACP methyl ester carboxylesterase
MPNYVELDGLRTWYDEKGHGTPLVLLHPGLADSRAFSPAIEALSARFHTFTPERRGHGHTHDVDGPITFDLMAADTIKFIERVVGGPAHLLGYSDGAIVALLVALRRPDLVRQVAAVAGVFHRDGWIPEVIDPSNTPPDFMAKSYGEVSPDGEAHFPVVAKKLADLHVVEPTLSSRELAQIRCRTLFMVGDDDEVTLEHAIEAYRSLPNGELAVVPGTSHGLLVEKPSLCNAMLLEFFALEPVETFAPIRRRGASPARS